jgi:aspartate/methionine/tyrosine aminotransferase
VWEATILDGSKPLSVLDIPTLRDRSVKVGSAGKIFSLTGWKIGWAVAAPELAEQVAASHQFITFTTHAFAMGGCRRAGVGDEWFTAHRARYVASKARLVGGLTQAGLRFAVGGNVVCDHRPVRVGLASRG